MAINRTARPEHRHDQNQGIKFPSGLFATSSFFASRDIWQVQNQDLDERGCLLRIRRHAFCIFYASNHVSTLVFFFLICRIASKLSLTSVPLLIHNPSKTLPLSFSLTHSILGNFYSIANLSKTKPARIFFAQGCEVVPEMSGFDDSQAA